ncbi:MAG TPA: hypothetical protein VNO33_05655 [Kofleriaceae bacterium]|nr:hypothetical protein [Kofleriaceae bacterium]
MLSRQLEMFDLDGEHLAAWLRLLVPPSAGEVLWAAVFVEGGRVVHAVRAGEGAIDPGAVALGGTRPADLATTRRALGVGLLAVIEVGAIARLHTEIDRRLRWGDDYPAQCLSILRVLKRQSGAGIWLEPGFLDLVPPLTPEPLERTFQLLVPSGTSILAYVFDARPPDVHASVIAVVDKGDISLVTTHLGLADALPGPALARSWRSQTSRVLSLVADRYAPPSIGLFVDRAAWQRILVGPSNQLAVEMAAGRLVFDPAPAWLRGLLGGAQLAAMASRSARNLARFVPSSARRRAGDLAQAAQDRLKSAGAHPFSLLGFDPIELWHQVRAYYRPSGSTRPSDTR